MFQTMLNRGLSVAGLGLLALAGWFWLANARGQALEIASTDVDMAEMPAGTHVSVALPVTTHGRHVRVVGVEFC
jgi:hypothetical protein